MRKPQILIVEHDEATRARIRMALAMDGCQAQTAASALEGLRQFDSGAEWDLVLVDEQLPDSSGLVTLKRMREINPAVALLLMATAGSISLAAEALRAGASGFLQKPLRLRMVHDALRDVLEEPGPSVGGIKRPVAEQTAPRILFRTMNGFRFWPAWLPTAAGQTNRSVRRAYEIRAPWGERAVCVLEVAARVLESVRLERGREILPADPLWDSVCQLALSNYLWGERALPPETLPVGALTGDQLQAIRGSDPALPAWG